MDFGFRQDQHKQQNLRNSMQRQDLKEQHIEQADNSTAMYIEEELINYDSNVCKLSLTQGNYLGMGFDEGYRKAASNTMVIGKHLGKLAKSFKMEEKWEFHCIGKL